MKGGVNEVFDGLLELFYNNSSIRAIMEFLSMGAKLYGVDEVRAELRRKGWGEFAALVKENLTCF